MVLPFSALAAAALYRKHRLFVTHSVGIVYRVGIDRAFQGRRHESVSLDHALSIVELLICGVYIYLAVGIVYGSRGAIQILTAAPLAVAVAAIFLGYRFALFLITLYST